MQISFIILFMIDLYKDNHLRACMLVCICLLFLQKKKKKKSSETIDWTFTKFHSSVPWTEDKIFSPSLQKKKSGLWSDTGAQAPLVTCLLYKSFKNNVGKGEIARHEQFPLFPQRFSLF